jgi:hypothetical protein
MAQKISGSGAAATMDAPVGSALMDAPQKTRRGKQANKVADSLRSLSGNASTTVNGVPLITAEDEAGFLDALPIAVVAMDNDHTIHYINEYAASVAGMPREDCVGKKFWDVLYDSPACRSNTCAAGHAVRTGKLSMGEAHMAVRGKDWPVRVICSPRKDEQGNICGCFQVMYECHDEIEVSRTKSWVWCKRFTTAIW